MKKQVLMVLVAILAIWHNSFAQNFTSIAPSGQTLYYNLVNGEAHVIRAGLGVSYNNYVSGNLIIPDSVSVNGNTYAVTAISTLNSSDGAFSNCMALSSVSIPLTVKTIGSWTFHNCSGLTSVTIGDSVISIGDCAFGNCTNLTSIIIPSNVTEIGTSAFFECFGLTSVTLGANVTSIGQNAFFNCSNITEMVSFSTTAPTLGSNSFYGISSTIDVHIPCGSQMSYNSSWYYFSNFIEDPIFFFNAISADVNMGTVYITNSSSCQMSTVQVHAYPECGYQFNHWSDGNTDNPRTLSLISDSSIVGYFTTQSNDTVFYYDTTYITVHDTTVLHDTTYLPVYVHDTTIMYDTLYTTVHDTVIAYVNVPVHDTVFAYIEVPVHDTVYLPQYIYDTIWLHDTITIHDTIYISGEGIDGVDALNAKVYSCNGQIVVDGASGNTVTLYDASGRVLATKHDYGTVIRFDAPASGTYMIKIGNYPARKVVVIR